MPNESELHGRYFCHGKLAIIPTHSFSLCISCTAIYTPVQFFAVPNKHHQPGKLSFRTASLSLPIVFSHRRNWFHKKKKKILFPSLQHTHKDTLTKQALYSPPAARTRQSRCAPTTTPCATTSTFHHHSYPDSLIASVLQACNPTTLSLLFSHPSPSPLFATSPLSTSDISLSHSYPGPSQDFSCPPRRNSLEIYSLFAHFAPTLIVGSRIKPAPSITQLCYFLRFYRREVRPAISR